LPKKYAKQSKITGGYVKYSNYSALTTSEVFILEPYLSDNTTVVSIKENETGIIVFWSNDKDDTDKPIFVQEFDSKGKLIREFETKIAYCKNEKGFGEISSEYKNTANSGSQFLFFGAPSNTPFGEYNLYPKVSKKSFQEVLTDGELRYIEIKKYRE